MQGLQHAGAFVVQFGHCTDFNRGHVEGRVEHVLTGQTMRFESVSELLAFVARVLAEGEGSSGVGVIGHSPKGVGVRGFSESGTGVVGHSELGIGGYFSGTKAPIRLQPAEGGEATPAGDHQVGELYVDAKANLYFCTGAGNPGVWKKIAMR